MLCFVLILCVFQFDDTSAGEFEDELFPCRLAWSTIVVFLINEWNPTLLFNEANTSRFFLSCELARGRCKVGQGLDQ